MPLRKSNFFLSAYADPDQATADAGAELFSGGGELGSRIRSFDWASTAMGPIAAWPQSLKTVVRILSTSRYAMWMGWGPDLLFLYNDTYARMTLGKKHPWALGRPARDVWAEIWPDIGPRIRRVMETGEATWDEGLLLFLERSGYPEETYHTFSYSPLTGDDGTINGLLCVVTEETKRIIGERQLGSLRALAAGLSAKITEKDVLAAVRDSLKDNPQDLPFTLTFLFEKGGARARLRCATGIDRGHPAAPEVIEEGVTRDTWPVHQLLKQKGSVVVANLAERFGALPTGAWDKAPTRAVLVPITRQGQDTPAGVIVAALNPYRQLDESYSGFIDLMAGQVAAGIANARAYEEERQRSEALAEIDKAKTAFFSNVSHEFRTPLTLMLGPTEDALASQERALRGAELETVHRNELRLLKLVNTLLDFSRLEAGRVKASYRATDLAAYTAELASVFKSAMEKAGLDYIVDCQPLPQPVYIDHEMWEKIVLNLISNALKSTFEGSIVVRLVDRMGHAELIVRDTGTGIPEQEIGHLFERFSRIENARRRTHEGSGIGLALVHELLNMHSGKISVRSQLGEGTTFTVCLPYGIQHLPQDRVSPEQEGAVAGTGREAFLQEALSWLPAQSSADPPIPYTDPADLDTTDALTTSPRVTGEKARVLLVDDNHDMREYVRRLMSSHFEVTTAKNGREALMKVAVKAHDLVLSDVMMPEMDGFQLLAALRKDPSTSSVPVILLSARAGEDSRIEGIQSGADDYLVKPFTARELLARVGAHIRLARFRREALAREARLKRDLLESEREQQTLLTGLQRTEQALEASQVRLNAIYSSMVEYIGLLTPDGTILDCNRASLQFAGNTREEVVGMRFWESPWFIHTPGAPERLRQSIERAAAGEFIRYEATLNRPSGGAMTFDFSLHPVRNDRGDVVYIVPEGRDITELKHAQTALLQSEKLAAVGRLSASIAHEINNPLEAITNLFYLIDRADELPESLRGFTRMAQQELARVSQIVTQTLRFHRQSTAKMAVSVSDLLDSVLDLYQGRLSSASVTVVRDYRRSGPLVCYEGELRQVFANLIGNALDATRGGGQIVVREREATDWRTRRKGVRVTVADNGHGISRDTLAHIFEPFFSTKSTTGTGLGLWVSLEIIQKHAGSIQVRSRFSDKHHGTVFSVFVPHRAPD
ncbi:MAG TPA: ATP-binding protein [Candidatus Angelobacter sp.]|nr:ATP-binding protein [Candidatus Angelobacter sp.]